jgi:hypothetical protein
LSVLGGLEISLSVLEVFLATTVRLCFCLLAASGFACKFSGGVFFVFAFWFDEVSEGDITRRVGAVVADARQTAETW